MKLYYAEFLNPRKACAVARHLNSPVEFVRVDFAGGQLSPELAAINPNRKVPVLEADGRILWESNAIMCFLARAAGSDLWPDDERQIEVLRWLFWDANHFSRAGGALYFQNIIKPMFGHAPDPAAVEESTGRFRTYAKILDDHLRGRRYLLDDTLTVADFAVGATLPYAARAQIPLAEFPAIERWHARLNALPAWREPFPVASAAA
ncbi:MAG: glutathione S-transferase family protein [Alphaproteobacteria bacterium]|nr:glutathione S-transferase family protein [Alphaproteobacteria bacterium]